MHRSLIWLITAVVGFAFMLFSYFNYQYEPGSNPWKDAFMYIGKERPRSEPEGVAYVARAVRLLPLSGRAANFIGMARSFGPKVENAYIASFQEKAFLYSDLSADFTDKELAWGRFPAADANEAVAGACASHKDKITIDGHTFEVVGQFKKEVRLFVNSYLVGNSPSAAQLFDPNNERVETAYILQLPRDRLTNSQVREDLAKAFPESQFTTYVPLIWTQQSPFYLYVTGLILLFFGGSLLLLRLYCLMAERLSNRWLGAPLAEISRHRRLLLTLHLVYFGVIVLFMLASYCLPELQVCLLSATKSQVTDGSGPLAVAGQAYMSKNILRRQR